ncbi:MAG: hypothetical protein M3O25_02870 [Actinomycetota bacterium]|nr:hypothetical protein [Actinomycetota bacterium]
MPGARALSAALFSLVLALGLASPARGEPGASGGGAEFVPGELLVRFEPGTSAAEGRAIARELGGRVAERLEIVPGLSLVKLNAKLGVREADRRFGSLDEVRLAEPNFIYRTQVLPDDSDFENLWGLQNTGQSLNGSPPGTPGADIDAPDAWDTTTGDPGVRVAVIDSGVTAGHPDLAANVWSNPGEIPGDGIDNGDTNTLVDDAGG